MRLGIRTFVKKALQGILIAVFFGIYYAGGCEALEELLLLSYGSLEIESIKYIVPVIFWILPQLHVTYLLKDYISDSLETSAAYIFTRTEKKGGWLLQGVFQLFLYVVIYYFIQFASVAVIGLARGLSFGRGYVGLPLVLTEFALVCLLNFFYVILINIGALRMKATYAYFAAFFINIFSVMAAGFLYDADTQRIFLLKYLPSSQGILAWHSLGNIADRYPMVFGFAVQSFYPVFSIIYLIGLSAALTVYGIYRLKNMDIY